MKLFQVGGHRNSSLNHLIPEDLRYNKHTYL